MKAQDVAMTPKCEACGAVSLPAGDARWQLHRLDDPREENAEREFGFLSSVCRARVPVAEAPAPAAVLLALAT